MERMPKAKQSSTAPTNDGAIVGYEARLWQMADALRGSMDAAEYKVISEKDITIHNQTG